MNMFKRFATLAVAALALLVGAAGGVALAWGIARLINWAGDNSGVIITALESKK